MVGWLPAIALAYFSWLLVAPWFSSYPYATWNASMQLALLPLVLLAWICVRGKHEKEAWRLAWRSLYFGAAILATWGIYDYIVEGTRAHGPLIDANAYAALINLFLLSTISCFLKGEPNRAHGWLKNFVPLVVIALLAFAHAMSLSRGGWLAFIAVVPLLVRRCRISIFSWRSGVVVLVFFLAHATMELSPIDTSRSVDALVQAPQLLETDANVQARLKIWRSTWNIITNSNPIVGTGLGTFKTYYSMYRDPTEKQSSGNLAHNDYLQALQEGGLIQLAFLLALVVFAPVRLLHQASDPNLQDNDVPTPASLLIGVVCLAIHSTVNFIQFVAPLALLTGLFLAHAWRTSATSSTPPRNRFGALVSVRPAFARAVAVTAIGIPVCVVVIDGAIFKAFSGRDWQTASLSPYQASMLNTATALRPSNPIPRSIFIRRLLQAARTTDERVAREQLLDAAEAEANIFIAKAPALAAGHYFLGTVRAARGAPNDLRRAREDFERAVHRVPPATGVRLELLRVYQRLGQKEQAYQSVIEARKWVHLEKDYISLVRFAHQAHAVAMDQRDSAEAAQWAWIYGRLTELGFTG